ncbi:MAG: hypothetical protein NUV90_00630 [Candidatus Parcubacteria bacterium]|nr:hypothetical protein [Candidatus Parcubacteria bacterium]
MDQTTNSSNTMWYTVGAVVVIALGFWYFYGSTAPTPGVQPTAVSQSANTTAAIANDLNAVPDVSAELTTDQAASAQTVSGF